MLSKIREALVRWFGMDVKDSRPSVVCVPEVAPPTLSQTKSGVWYDSNGKVCTQCGEYVLYDGYTLHKCCVGGRSSWCKVCTAAHVRAARAAKKGQKHGC